VGVQGFTAVVGVAVLATSIVPRAPVGDRLVAGPVLSGDEVVWVTDGAGELLVRTGTGVLHRQPRQQGRSDFWIDGLGASSNVVSFRLQESFCPAPTQTGPTTWTVESCFVTHRTLAGRSSRPFGVISSPVVCSGAIVRIDAGPDVDGERIALHEPYELNCRSGERDVRHRIVVRTFDGSIVAVPYDGDSSPRDVRIAGRYVAWSFGQTIVVHDWVARVDAYRVDIPAPRYSEHRFDLQADGKIALAYDVGVDRPFTKVLWYAPGRRAWRYVANLPDTRPDVRLASDRLVFPHYSRTRGAALVVSDLDGNARELMRLGPVTRLVGAVDFDGTRAAWATVAVTRISVDCPPPGMGRPCIPLYDGIRSIWAADIGKGVPAPRLVAREEFSGHHDLGAEVESEGLASSGRELRRSAGHVQGLTPDAPRPDVPVAVGAGAGISAFG
jgi:hypothetical protein